MQRSSLELPRRAASNGLRCILLRSLDAEIMVDTRFFKKINNTEIRFRYYRYRKPKYRNRSVKNRNFGFGKSDQNTKPISSVFTETDWSPNIRKVKNKY